MATTATISKAKLWGGGVEPLKASYGKLMMWFFLLSDAFTFSGLLITYAFLRWSAPAYNGDPEAFTFQPNIGQYRKRYMRLSLDFTE